MLINCVMEITQSFKAAYDFYCFISITDLNQMNKNQSTLNMVLKSLMQKA